MRVLVVTGKRTTQFIHDDREREGWRTNRSLGAVANEPFAAITTDL